MSQRSMNEAAIPNARLTPFATLIGSWNTIGSHPYFPDTLFSWSHLFPVA
jgi:hypothetical protein